MPCDCCLEARKGPARPAPGCQPPGRQGVVPAFLPTLRARSNVGMLTAWRGYASTSASGRRARRPSRSAGSGGRRDADLRRAAPRCAPAPLRLPPRARRRPRELGGAEGDPARARAAPSRRPRRGPPARLRRLRGRDPGGSVRGRNGRDLGPGHVRAARGEARRRADRPPPRRAAPGHLDARAREAGQQREELAPAPQAGRPGAAPPRRAATYAPMLATLAADVPTGDGVALRGEVGRLPGDRRGRRRRGHVDEPAGQRPDAALRRRRARARARRSNARLRPRRRGLRARRGWAGRASRVMQQGLGAARLLRLRRARGRRRAADRPPARASDASGSRELLDPRGGVVRFSEAFEDGQALFDAAKEQGLEGIVAKRPSRGTSRASGRAIGSR